MAEQTTPRQQPASYPSGYPSPSMQATYSYPPPNNQNNAEPYRASPTGSNTSVPGPTLPPISSIDGQSQRLQQQQQSTQQQMGSPLPPPVAPMSAYYPHQHPQPLPPYGQPGVTSSPNALAMRYQLPPQGPDQRIMSGGRHKKEIKRRTKTGCLTCRKRRIKCDEAHPTCRNCQKSKRECLGYDPIFKQQPGPPQIQPAPSASPAPSAATTTAPPAQAAYSGVPQGYAPTASAGYAPAAMTKPESAGGQSYDLGSAIDPALAGGDTGAMAGPAASYHAHPDIKTALGSASAAMDSQPLKVKPLKTNDLFAIGDVPVPLLPSGPDPIPTQEITDLYNKHYAPSMDLFMETTWYGQKGLPLLLNNPRLSTDFAGLLAKFADTQSGKSEVVPLIRPLEAKVVWDMLCLCRSVDAEATNESEAKTEAETNGNGNTAEPPTNGTTPPADPGKVQLLELQKRLDVFEALLTGATLESNPVQKIPYPKQLDTNKYWEVEFWRWIGVFVSTKEAKDNDSTLSECRTILGQLENRDVIYSIAVARNYGQRVPGFPDRLPMQASADDTEENKLIVAKGFLYHEVHQGQSTAISRICDMAIRSWQLFR